MPPRASQSAHDRVLFQHHALHAQVRQLVRRRQSCRTSAEDHNSNCVVTCYHHYSLRLGHLVSRHFERTKSLEVWSHSIDGAATYLSSLCQKRLSCLQSEHRADCACSASPHPIRPFVRFGPRKEAARKLLNGANPPAGGFMLGEPGGGVMRSLFVM